MSSESSKQTQKAPALEFHGGVYTSLVPFLLFVLGSFGLAIFNVATVEGFWLCRHRLYYHRYVAL